MRQKDMGADQTVQMTTSVSLACTMERIMELRKWVRKQCCEKNWCIISARWYRVFTKSEKLQRHCSVPNQFPNVCFCYHADKPIYIYIYMLMLARIFNICILLKNIFILCQLQGCNFMSAFSFHIPRHWQKQSNHETSTFTNANHSNSYKKNIFYLLNWVCVINRHSKKMNPQPVKDRLLSIQPARECRYKWC